jgi:hypothetical protein
MDFYRKFIMKSDSCTDSKLEKNKIKVYLLMIQKNINLSIRIDVQYSRFITSQNP